MNAPLRFRSWAWIALSDWALPLAAILAAVLT
jgi:hypothetical protein